MRTRYIFSPEMDPFLCSYVHLGIAQLQHWWQLCIAFHSPVWSLQRAASTSV